LEYWKHWEAYEKKNENREKDQKEVAQPEVEGLEDSFDPNDQNHLENQYFVTVMNPNDEASFSGHLNMCPLARLLIFTNLVSMCMFEFFIFNL